MTNHEPSERDKLLTSWEQYRSEVLNEPSLSDAEIQELAKQANSGNEEAKELFVKQCLRFVIYDSSKYTQFVYNYDEHMDLVDAANEGVAKALDQALPKREPAPYLRVVIRNALIEQSVYYQRYVKQNVSLERLGLDEHLVAKTQQPEPEEHPEMHRVREALDSLTEKQRYVVLRHFGLDGDAPESLYALNKRMSSVGARTHIANKHLRIALNRLRHLLKEEEHSSSFRLDILEAHKRQRELAYEHLAAIAKQSEPENHPEVHKVREALNSLTEKQRHVVLRYFGLDGHDPESLTELSRQMSSTGKDTGIADKHLQLALNHLGEVLERSTPLQLNTQEAHKWQREPVQEAQAAQQEWQAAFHETLEYYKDEIPEWIEAQDRLDTTTHEPFHDHDIGFDR